MSPPIRTGGIDLNFASDNWAGATPEVMAAIARHNEGFAPAYGADPLTEAVTRRFSEIFERVVEVHFVATGTAANSLSMAALARPGGLVFCSADAHLHNDEYGATEFLTGMKLVAIRSPAGKLTAEALSRALAAYPADGRTGPATALTLTNATECGTVYSAAETAALAGMAKERGMTVHLDGARFANAVAATGASPAALTWQAGADVMSFGGTKNGCLGAEAIVVFEPHALRDLRVLRQRAGHVVSKARFVAAQFEGYFADDGWLATARHANAMAARLGEGLRSRGDARLAWESQANEVFPILPKTTIARLREAGAMLYEWPAPDVGHNEDCVRLVTGFATTADEVDRFLALL
jgi:threonine aldolase